MARVIPYVFCRYWIAVQEEVLDATGQEQFLKEIQGGTVPHGRVRDDRPQSTALVMAPSEFVLGDDTFLKWEVGIRAGVRLQTEYDSKTMTKSQRLVADSHIKFAPVLALPERGIMAVEDRSNDEQISAKQAISAFRSVVNHWHDGDAFLGTQHGNPDDIRRWLSEWNLEEYSYTISPLNPISASDLAERRSEAMKRENVGRDTGKVRPPEGESMRPNGGIIEETNELAVVGYAQRGFKGVTPDGHVAHVPKPRFHDDRHKNLAEQEKPHFVRVLIDPESGDGPLDVQVAAALRRFYGE